MARPFICKIVGRGVENDPYRAAVDGLKEVSGYKAVIRSDLETGHPFFPWTVVSVEASDYAAIEALPDCISLPVSALNNALTASQRTAIETKAASLGFTDITISAGTTLRQLLRTLVKRHYAHTDEREVL